MIEVRDLKKTFILNNGRKISAVNGVSFRTQDDETLGIVGESGCGKSTLGRLILRLIEPSGGHVFFRDRDITHSGRHEMRAIRKHMQMIFQNPFASFNPKMRIGSALLEVCRYYGMSVDESRERMSRLLTDTGLSEDMLYQWPRELSGGQLQRLAIARALLSEPSLVIADEPLSALDVSVQAQLLNLLTELRKKRAMVMIFISHDMNVVEYFCDRVAVMYMGIIMEQVSAAELSVNALHPYTLSLRASAPKLDVFKDSGGPEKVIVKGETPDPRALVKGCPFAPRCPEAGVRCKEDLPELKEISPDHLVRCWGR